METRNAGFTITATHDDYTFSVTGYVSAKGYKNVDIELSFVSTILDDNDWATISAVAASGKASSYWEVGDIKAVTLNGKVGTVSFSNTTLYVYIIGFNHNGSIGTIDFGTFKNASGVSLCLSDAGDDNVYTDGTKYYNPNHWGYYTYGGWAGCDMRYDILGSTDKAPSGYGSAVSSSRVGYNPTSNVTSSPVSNTLMAAFPSSLRAVMAPMTLYTDNKGNAAGNSNSNITTTVDYLPLLSEYEVFGTIKNGNTYEANYQAQYSYYANGNSKVKYKHSSTSSSTWWWLRSPDQDAMRCFVIVYS